MANFCKNCGNPWDGNGAFCKFCGAPVAQNENIPVTPPPTITQPAPEAKPNNYYGAAAPVVISAPKKSRTWLIALIAIVLIAAVAVVAVLLLNNSDTDSSGSSASSNTGIVGTWKTTINYADLAGSGDMGGMEEYIDIDRLNIDIILKFTKDGECTMYADEKSVDRLIDVMADGTEDMLKDMAKEYGISYKDLLEEMGVSDIRDMMAAQIDASEMEESGEYTWKDGVLTINGEEKDVELKGNTLTIDLDGIEFTFKRK